MYELQRTQRIPASAEQVWNFIASAQNLKEITPGHMGFEITSRGLPDKMYAGMFICYNVRPLLGVKIKWVTEITQLKEQDYFVDEQRKGPYRRWVHTHAFADERGGTRVADSVEFEVPFGWLVGRFVMRDVKRIFAFRHEALLERFGGSGPSRSPGPS